jgi:hypothetical protein
LIRQVVALWVVHTLQRRRHGRGKERLLRTHLCKYQGANLS